MSFSQDVDRDHDVIKTKITLSRDHLLVVSILRSPYDELRSSY